MSFQHGDPCVKRWGGMSNLHCSSNYSKIMWVVPKIKGGWGGARHLSSDGLAAQTKVSQGELEPTSFQLGTCAAIRGNILTQQKPAFHSGSKWRCITSRQFNSKGGMKAEKRASDRNIIPITNAPWLNNHPCLWDVLEWTVFITKILFSAHTV